MGADVGESDLVAYFGYGSLVNRDTHRTEIVGAQPARLKGWRRHWVRRDSQSSLALLSVRRDPGSVIDGLLVIDRARNLPSVDQREERYRRAELASADLVLSAPVPGGCPLFVYEASAVHPPVQLDIIQSYLDAVLQGFLREFGREGVERFVAETEGFDARLIADRKKPNYPRSVVLEREEEVFFDALIAQKITNFASFVR